MESYLGLGDRKILITGANGFVGRRLTRYLASHGYRLVALVRRKVWACNNVEFIEGDLFDLPWLSLVQRDFGAVLHLAATLGMYDRDRRLYRGNVLLTQKLLDYFRGSGVFFIYFSSIEAFGPTGLTLAKETDPPHPLTDYGYYKWQAEQLVRNSGLPYVILRVGNVVDDRQGLLAAVIKILHGSSFTERFQAWFVRHVIADAELNLIRLDDLGRAVEKVLENSSKDQLFFLTNQRISLGEIVKGEGQAVGQSRKLYPLVSLFCLLCRLLKRSPFFCYLAEGSGGRRYRRYSNEKVRSELGLEFQPVL